MAKVVTREQLIEMIVELEPSWREVFDDSPSEFSGEFLLSTYRDELDKSIKREYSSMISNFMKRVKQPTKSSKSLNQLSLWENEHE